MDATGHAPAPPASPAPSGEGGPHDEQFRALYAELHRIALRESRRLGNAADVSPTTLLHEAYLQMAHRRAGRMHHVGAAVRDWPGELGVQPRGVLAEL